MSTLRSDIRTRARDYLYETTANVWSDAALNRLVTEEVNSLPSKQIYKEYLWSFSTVKDDQDYPFETGIVKIEKLERNDGTDALPDWQESKGWDTYNNILYLHYRPSGADSMRGFCKSKFTAPTDDSTALDVPDEKTEIVVLGVVLRAYRVFMGYLRGNVSWDSVTKPGDVALPTVQGWIRDVKEEYKDLVRQYATNPRPRDIDLVS